MTERLPFDTTDPRLAAAAWSRLVEPGDTAAGILVDRLGAVAALDWLLHVHSGSGAVQGRPWEKAVTRWLPRLEKLDIRRELAVLDRLGGRLLIAEDAAWPAALDDLGEQRPFALWVRGPAPLAPHRSVAVVGARAATRYGEQVTLDLAAGLAERGVTVLSGGAYGIDAAAHRGALAQEEGVTVAVLAGGVDRWYPAGNSALLERVIVDGAAVSEVPPGCAPSRSRFLMRNRLIAALATATVVVEAAWRSGALNTAGHAAGLLRPVGAVPGPVTSMSSVGCHRLLREGGAVCVTDVTEVLELISPAGEQLAGERAGRAGLLDDLDPVHARVLDALPLRASAPVSSLARTSGLAVSEVRAALGYLELAGRAQHNGDAWRRSR